MLVVNLCVVVCFVHVISCNCRGLFLNSQFVFIASKTNTTSKNLKWWLTNPNLKFITNHKTNHYIATFFILYCVELHE